MFSMMSEPAIKTLAALTLGLGLAAAALAAVYALEVSGHGARDRAHGERLANTAYAVHASVTMVRDGD